MNERGSALLTVVISILVISMASGLLFSMTMSNTRLVQSVEAGILANKLADAGIQYGISVLKKIEFKADDDLPSPEFKSNPFGEGGSFSVQWVELSEEESVMIISTGKHGKITRVKTAGFLVGSDDGGGTGEPGGGEGTPNYPTWSPSKQYLKGEYTKHTVNVDGVSAVRLFRARDTTYAGHVPGTLWGQWQEITNHFRKYNFYELENSNTIVYYGSTYWQLKYTSYGSVNEPTKNSHPSSAAWHELIDEWRPYEGYPEKEVVTYQGKRYRVGRTNVTGPPSNTSNSGWELLSDSVRTLQKVSITPSSSSLKIGEKVTFTATAHFSDGTTEDVTNKAVWKSTYPQIAAISGNVATGLMDTGVEGCNSSLISASYTYVHPTRNDIVINRVGVTELRVSGVTSGGDLGGIIWEREVPPAP